MLLHDDVPSEVVDGATISASGGVVVAVSKEFAKLFYVATFCSIGWYTFPFAIINTEIGPCRFVINLVVIVIANVIALSPIRII